MNASARSFRRALGVAGLCVLNSGCFYHPAAVAMNDTQRLAHGQSYSHRDQTWYDQPRSGWRRRDSTREANNMADYQRYEQGQARERRRVEGTYGPGSFLNQAAGDGLSRRT